jgi:hypothetical protein
MIAPLSNRGLDDEEKRLMILEDAIALDRTSDGLLGGELIIADETIWLLGGELTGELNDCKLEIELISELTGDERLVNEDGLLGAALLELGLLIVGLLTCELTGNKLLKDDIAEETTCELKGDDATTSDEKPLLTKELEDNGLDELGLLILGATIELDGLTAKLLGGELTGDETDEEDTAELTAALLNGLDIVLGNGLELAGAELLLIGELLDTNSDDEKPRKDDDGLIEELEDDMTGLSELGAGLDAGLDALDSDDADAGEEMRLDAITEDRDETLELMTVGELAFALDDEIELVLEAELLETIAALRAH